MMNDEQPIIGIQASTGLNILLEPYTHYLGGEYLTILEGFVWDGASIPKRLRWLVYNDRIKVPALIHDFLYSKCGQATTTLSLSRKEADQLFRLMMIADGMSGWKATLVYHAVRLFGGWTWQANEG